MDEAAPRAAPAPLPEVSLVVPVFNEEATLEEVCRRATATLEELGKPFEVIVVDDGSRDGTWAIVEGVVAADPRVRGVRFKRNFGQHPAMHAGLVRARGDIVVTMDADLQNVPEDLPRLIAAVEGGVDVASGRRMGSRSKGNFESESAVPPHRVRCPLCAAFLPVIGSVWNGKESPIDGVIGRAACR